MSLHPVFDCHADILMDVVKRRREGETAVFRSRHLSRLREGGVAGAVLIHCHMYDTPAGPEDIREFIRLFREEDRENAGVWSLILGAADAARAEETFRAAAEKARDLPQDSSGAAAPRAGEDREASGPAGTEDHPRAAAEKARALPQDASRAAAPRAGEAPEAPSCDEGPLPALVGMEGLKAVQGDFSLVERMHREAGLRLASLTQNDQNDLATGHWGDPDRGLTPRGRDFVRLLNELGVLIDLAHANEPCQREILALSRKPVLMSHTSAKAVYDNGRNYSDDQLRAVAREGGCVGCMTSAAALADKDDRKNHSLERYIQHLEHMLEVLGEDHLVLGLHYTEYLYPGPDFLDTRGLEDASRTGNIIGALRRRGWPEETIGKVAWGNVFRLFRDTLA